MLPTYLRTCSITVSFDPNEQSGVCHNLDGVGIIEVNWKMSRLFFLILINIPSIQPLRGYLAPLVTAFGASGAHFPQVPLKLLSRVASYYVSHSTPIGVGAFPMLPQVSRITVHWLLITDHWYDAHNVQITYLPFFEYRCWLSHGFRCNE